MDDPWCPTCDRLLTRNAWYARALGQTTQQLHDRLFHTPGSWRVCLREPCCHNAKLLRDKGDPPASPTPARPG